MRIYLVLDVAALMLGWVVCGRGWPLWWFLCVGGLLFFVLWSFDRYREVRCRTRGLALVSWLSGVWGGFVYSAGGAFLLRPEGVTGLSLMVFWVVVGGVVALSALLEKGFSMSGVCESEVLCGVYMVFKRLFDVVLSVLLIGFLSPLLIIVAALVKLTSKGAAFFIQERVGRGGVLFPMMKFRSMVEDAERILREDKELAEEYNRDFKIFRDPRITPIGRVIRKTSVDEIPQLFNVVLGHMSIVGPRPVKKEELERHTLWVWRYLSVRPGITGMWQVNGRNNLPYQKRVVYNVYYCKYLSLWLDLKILFKTVMVVLRREGVV